jgi:predicted RNA-binding Zn-ribbon protein involved in translation (DUF1610 family)
LLTVEAMKVLPDHILLCETCGYVLEGLESEPRCPECGTQMAWSLPSRRTGTPWQQRPGVWSLLRTAWQICSKPRVLFDVMSTTGPGWRTLLLIYLLVAATLFAAPWPEMGSIRAPFPSLGPKVVYETARYVTGSVLNTAIALGVLFALTWIEVVGIRFFSARRGWRLSNAASWQIAAHSSMGWSLCGLLTLLGLATMTAIDRLSPSVWRYTLDLSWATLGVVSARNIALVVLPMGGFVAGMLVFESLVYIGVLRCRYANAPRALGPVEPLVTPDLNP